MLHKKIRSFGYALKGIRLAWKEEQNFRIEITLGCAAILLGVMLHISLTEWLFVIGAAALVLCAEALNTALEELCDMLRSTHDPHVEKIKDISAGAVFIASLGSLVIGLIVFLPHLLLL